ncbi:protein tyrosine phosphatase family protein [Ideonella sp. YS5]|uniref:protein tyrosine phosphatase family protein n=1 Tax=Ideonella sp. YS5 TaxID=3453714 RepID=UPI003EEFB968
MKLRRRDAALGLAAWAGLGIPMMAWGEGPLAAPNVVLITPKLVTSGQPSAEALARLGEQGFQAVVYLAPLSLPNAVKDEPGILARQHIEFVNIPINFGKPSAEDFEQVAATLDRWQDRKVLVHCEVNMRASSMVFLYRTLRLKEKPEVAYEAVEKVWSPRGVWRELIVAQLKQGGVAFEPY